MSTKRKFAEQLRNILYPNPTPDAKLDLQVAMTAVSQSRDEYVRNMIFQNKMETNIVYGNWVSSYNDVQIKYDKSRKEYYSFLPVNVISLDGDRGVQRVFRDGYPEDEYLPLPRGFKSMFSGSIAKSLEGESGFYLAGNKIIYVQNEDVDCKMCIDVVAQSEDIGMYEEFPVDSSATLQILTRALDIYKLQKGIPEDAINNGISE
jgi:hypothetical protein